MFQWSENPYRDMWNHIRFLGKESNCRRLLNGSIGSERAIVIQSGPDLDRKAAQIAMTINQAAEYFEAADNVTIRTSPLLLFYGMLSLAKAAIVANVPGVYLETMMYHGLKTKTAAPDLKAYNDDPSRWAMEAEFAVTAGGVFELLTGMLSGQPLPRDSIILFKDILAIVPEIAPMFERYYGELSRTVYLYSMEQDSRSITLSLGSLNEAEVEARFPTLRESFRQTSVHHDQALKYASSRTTLPDDLGIWRIYGGSEYLVSGLKCSAGGISSVRNISPACIDYVAVYILSLCVRYKQDFWVTIIEGRNSGVLGLIEMYTNVIKRRFPNIILNSIFGEPFEYGTVARLG